MKISSLGLAGILMIATVASPLSSMFTVQALADTYSAIENPEAYLTVLGKTNNSGNIEGFADYSYLSKLNSSTDYVVTSLGINLPDVLNSEPLTLNCDLSTPKTVSETKKYCSVNFTNQLQALENLKNNASKQNNPEVKAIKPALKQVNNGKLSETKKELQNQNNILNFNLFSRNKAKINTISFQGKTKRIEQVKSEITKLYPQATIQYTTTKDIQDQQKALDKEVQDKVVKEGVSKEEASKTILNQKIQAEINKLPKQEQDKVKQVQNSNANIKPISEQTIQKIESIKTIDENTGNTVLDQNKLNKLNITKEEQDTVKSAISTFNSQPITVKTNLTNTLQEEGKKVDTGNNKVSLLEGVKVEAGCGEQASASWYWWGGRVRMNQCYAQRLRDSGAISFAGASASGVMCAIAGILAGWGAIGCGLFVTVWGYISSYIMRLGYDEYNIGRWCGGWARADVRAWGYSAYC
jgi:hypothetical protein